MTDRITTSELPPELTAEHDRRMRQARARAGWVLGDPSYADLIVGAYLHPDEDAENLLKEMAG